MVGGGGFTASVSGSLFQGAVVGSGTAVTSPACVITATGGSGVYTYAWTRTSGDATTVISDATAASVTWSRSFGPVGMAESFWQCIVSDGTGATVTISNIQVQLERE